ncbi:MAG TPA: CRTAC1 family protein [Lacunisphaera sp.]|nr:CRTAC1 family protein [Lacunisphaera sp.]
MTPTAPPSRDRPGPAPAGVPAAAAVPPLLPVILTLVVAAILLSVVFARLFPSAARSQALPAARFTDITVASGVRFVQHNGLQPSPTTLGGGVAVLDYDGDGRPDLLFVGGTRWPWEDDLAKHVGESSLVLYHNEGGGRFNDVTASAGLTVELQGMGAAVGDFDNDGLPDVFVTCVGTNHLFHNRGHGQFEDVTEQAGVGGADNSWSTGATWIDIDNDGRLDLVVAHYARWPEEVPLAMAFSIADLGRSYGAPAGFIAALPSVYRNVGHGRFVPVPGAAGLRTIDRVTGLPAAKALAVTPLDANGDGKLDLLFTYHTAENALFLNQGDGTFRPWVAGPNARNEGVSAGVATASLLALASRPDVDERLAAWQAASGPRARDGFVHLDGKLGAALLDYEFDGHLAVFAGGGRAEPDTNKFEGGRDFAAPPRLLLHRNDWLPAPVAGRWSQPVVARGIAVADLDGDGDDDVVIVQHGGPAIVLRNDQHSGLPWLRLQLIATRSQPEAGGARVELHTPRRIQVQTVAPAMGFLAQSESVLTFGLGEDARVRKIVIRWPSGQRQELRPTGLNRTLVIREP